MTNEERIKADALKAAEGIGDESRRNAYYHGHRDGATAEQAHMQPVIEAAEKVAKIFAHKGDHQTCAICQLARAIEQWKGKEVEQAKAKEGFIRVILAGAHEVSKDAESAEAYLKGEGIDVAQIKANAQYFTWKTELIRVTKEKTGESVVRVNDEEAVKWYNDGFTPEQTFRETWQSDGD